ncbi:MAG: hypothetical protein L0221_09355 [Chloroflexi bacterium]|nr:hypothetical protein [Chloroflexota bacterium]
MTAAQVVRAVPSRILADVTGAAVRSVERWRAGVVPRRHAYVQRLDDLSAVMDLLGPSMSNRGKQAWLTSRSTYLGFQRPVDVLAAGEFDRVRGAARAYVSGEST